MDNKNTESKLVIQTPEQVEFEYELAGIGSRFLAFLFDLMVRIVGIVVIIIVVITVLVVIGILPALFKDVPFNKEHSHSLLWLGAAVLFLLYFLNTGYYIFFETIWSGQSPGKRLMNLRVIKDGGYPIGFFEAAVRNLLRVVDILPGGYILGGLCVFFGSQSKRIGDHAAGTIVIKEKGGNIPESIFKDLESGTPVKELREIVPYLVNVKRQEYNMVVEFLERRSDMDELSRRQMAKTIGGSLLKKFNFSIPEGMTEEDFLIHFAVTYRRHMKFL